MLTSSIGTLLAAAAVFGTSMSLGQAVAAEQKGKAEIGFVQIDEGITLRRMAVHTPNPKGTVLFLHGFPETLLVWKDISTALGDDYEVRASDWPTRSGLHVAVDPPLIPTSSSP